MSYYSFYDEMPLLHFLLFPLKFYPGGGDGMLAARAETQGQEKNGIEMHDLKDTKNK